jgi:uncharacterized membrane protein
MNIKDFIAPFRNQPDRYIISNFLLFGIELVASIPAIGGVALIYFFDPSPLWILSIVLILISLVLLIIIMINFKFVFYLLLDDEELSIKDAFHQTYQMMHSHRGRLLYMELSFMGMYLLGILSLGIGLFWIEPYINQTTVLLYLNIRGELESTVNYYA